ncbi:ATP/GTP-binding protein [Streptomyces sp. NPDC057579]|uniref:ATP/GTP-binding protein n=1 Tax=Streptomyces sp. NPDC057579 TaxID=3346172 RepID=UPI0036C1347F
MDTEGTQDARNIRSDQVPRPAHPAEPPPRPAAPPAYAAPPASGGTAGPRGGSRTGEGPQSPLMAWLGTPRVPAGPGVWAFGHRPKPKDEPHEIAVPQLIAGAVVSALCAWLIWSLLMNDYLGPYWKWPREVMLPDSWKTGNANVVSSFVYMAIVLGVIAIVFGRIGRWPELLRRLVTPVVDRLWARLPEWLAPKDPSSLPSGQLMARTGATLVIVWLLWQWCTDKTTDSSLLMLQLENLTPVSGQQASFFYYATSFELLDLGALLLLFSRFACLGELRRRYLASGKRGPQQGTRKAAASGVRPLEVDQAEWTDLRAAGAATAADRLAQEARSGLMNDVDHARIGRAWQSVQTQPSRLPAFIDGVHKYGSAAFPHPSGARDLHPRTARHDLVTAQVRIGTASEDVRNPYNRRGAGVALEPDVLGTSLLAVGPAGSGKTTRLVRPLVEAMCLQALSGRATVVSVGPAGAASVADDAFDAVVRVGHRDAACSLDLYGGTTDPDEAAAMLAEALVGDLVATVAGDGHRAAAVLGQLLGPFRAAHGRFPRIPELRELLDGSPQALTGLRAALEANGENHSLRELDVRARQSERPGDPGVLLADRIALLDRPAFAGLFDPSDGSRQVSLRSLDRPMRIRIDLPERGHADASRILARLVLAQFTECAVTRADRSLFACLVVDDASHVITQEALRGLQRLRTANAGVALTVRALDDVPESLRGALLGAVGCRMAFAGVTTWDGARFAEVWGKAWVETRDVTDRQIVSDEPFTKVMHSIRRLVTGKNVTAKAVTVRTVERERWSASDLANSVPPGHAVLSVTSVTGESAPPVLIDLRP